MKNAKFTHKKRLKLWESSINSRSKWIDPETSLFYPDLLEDRSCPVCGVDGPELMFEKEGGRYQQCSNCTMTYLSPVFKDEYLNKHYENNHTVQSETVSADLDFYHVIYGQGLDLVLDHSKVEKVLDIGCSSGVFLDMCAKRGWETYGIELNVEEAKLAAKNHEVFTCQLSDVKPDIKFELISMWDVFEHIKDGASILKEVSSRLAYNGTLFLQIPSSGSLAARILQDKCNMFDGLEHVNLYNKYTIELLAERNGYNVVGYQTVISEEAVINNYLNYESPYSGSFKQSPPLFSEQYILDRDLGYKIQALLKIKKI